jgi:hypothetical protein
MGRVVGLLCGVIRVVTGTEEKVMVFSALFLVREEQK